MQQRPLFKQQRKPSRLIRRAALLGIGAFALGAIAWQFTQKGDAPRPIDQTNTHDIPLLMDRPDGAAVTGLSTDKPEQAATENETNPGQTAQAFARPVSLASRPNFHIPGAEEALEAIEAPGDNNAMVENAPQADESVAEHIVTVKPGDTLSTIFEQAGLGYSDVLRILDLGDEAQNLERIRPGETLVLMTDDEERFAGLKYELNAESELNIFRETGDDLVAEINQLPSETREVAVGGQIKGSLYQSAIATGVPPAQIMQLAEVFGWKVDFLRDVRNGDQFKLVYEVREREGESIGTGKLVAAEFITGSRSIKAVRYTSPDGTTGYYEPDGSSLERGFLRHPVEFSRISSNFNPKRLHPIHNTVRPHNGVDLAAPTGTSVKSAASGRVTFVGWKHGYGKVIQVRHDAKYETLYAHLSGFKGNLKRGARVDKGATIGFVGMTGAATGPHLHYEFKVNGKPLDPVKVELPEANPIASEHRKDFLAQTRASLDQLARISVGTGDHRTARLAQNQHANESE